MRILYPNIDRAKKSAKGLKSALQGISLNKAQFALARILEFRDWHELDQFYKENHEPKAFPVENGEQLAVVLCLKLAEKLDISWPDALYALSEAYIPDVNLKTEESYKAVWLKIMREKHDFPNKERAIGSIVNVKGLGSKPLYITASTHLISHGSFMVARADFKIITPESPLPLFVPARLIYPYGCYIEADGAKVLYSRDYMPLWRVKDNKKPERMDPWIKINYVDQKHFWNEGGNAWHSKKTFAPEQKILRDFGITALPKLADVLPELIFNPNIVTIGEAMDEVVKKLPRAKQLLAY